MLKSSPAKKPSATPLLLALLLSACATLPQPSPLPVAPPAILPLPLAARQPKTDPVCLPTCSAALQRDLTSWQSLLTAPVSPASSASALTTR